AARRQELVREGAEQRRFSCTAKGMEDNGVDLLWRLARPRFPQHGKLGPAAHQLVRRTWNVAELGRGAKRGDGVWLTGLNDLVNRCGHAAADLRDDSRELGLAL